MAIKYEVDGRKLNEEEISELEQNVFGTDYYDEYGFAQPSAEKVKETRMGLHLTQAAAARVVHIEHQTWSKYELKGGSGARQIPIPTWHLFLLLTKVVKLPK